MRELAGPAIHPWRRTLRYWLSRLTVAAITRAWTRIRVEGREQLPRGPAIYAFNHLSWADPFVLMATLPFRPRLWFFGPKEEDMAVGGRNRVMHWTGTSIPYKPAKNDLLEATRRVGAAVKLGGVVAIAAEGRIGPDEQGLMPLNQGAAYFALRSGIPLVPVAINGTSWLRFGGRVRVRVGEPILVSGRPDRESVVAVTDLLESRLRALIADAPTPDPPGRFGRWLTDVFNDWPEGSRAAAEAAADAVRAGRDGSKAPDAGSPAAPPPAPDTTDDAGRESTVSTAPGSAVAGATGA